jgi:hypothetical protein
MPIKRMYQALPWVNQKCVNGTIIILEPETPVAITPEMAQTDAIAEEETAEFDARLKIHAYFSFMLNQAPSSFEEYYRLKANTTDVTLMFGDVCRVWRRSVCYGSPSRRHWTTSSNSWRLR